MAKTLGPRESLAGRSLDRSNRTVLVSSVASDSHTWNLVYLQLLISELGFDVVNLGACVPDELLVSECRSRRPVMVVISSVNGHGYQEGRRVIRALREQPELQAVPMVIGGKLGVSGGESTAHVDDLLRDGFDAVFDDREDGGMAFREYITEISPARPKELRALGELAS
jgi:methylaspartate mutase sigma subunit